MCVNIYIYTSINALFQSETPQPRFSQKLLPLNIWNDQRPALASNDLSFFHICIYYICRHYIYYIYILYIYYIIYILYIHTTYDLVFEIMFYGCMLSSQAKSGDSEGNKKPVGSSWWSFQDPICKKKEKHPIHISCPIHARYNFVILSHITYIYRYTICIYIYM